MSISAVEMEKGYGAIGAEAKPKKSSWRRTTLVALAAGAVVIVGAAAHSASAAKKNKFTSLAAYGSMQWRMPSKMPGAPKGWPSMPSKMPKMPNYRRPSMPKWPSSMPSKTETPKWVEKNFGSGGFVGGSKNIGDVVVTGGNCPQLKMLLKGSSECPDGVDDMVACDHPSLGVGDFCEADGECETDKGANNCPNAAGKLSADVYKVVAHVTVIKDTTAPGQDLNIKSITARGPIVFGGN